MVTLNIFSTEEKYRIKTNIDVNSIFSKFWFAGISIFFRHSWIEAKMAIIHWKSQLKLGIKGKKDAYFLKQHC